ncbi:hypothetical protein [Colwellia hornerae]|uniref:LRAT domain-containing protein n=1 Tax=Colwellia hornerae TaxID=89402 RepID=A0A5C6QR66_9GAMM|nr:hypothetical protein [Colwellia hornerae]TWX55681.1 hypothetical protein ESZ28_05780 [Colwellia hornerae]TWX61891.1 hypothetical protein ESZ26_04555 [Colwellia hornerae]TWX71223.1 hypothetical protein ESZ27_02135 [Colwellia hornerae]
MPLPLLWLGAAAISAFAVKELADDRKRQQQKRFYYRDVQSLDKLKSHESPVVQYPTDIFNTSEKVKPEIGAIVCCGVGGLLDHTGIWIGDDTIVELDGNGLIKAISVARFTKERSGKYIFIACDSKGKPIASELAAQRAQQQIFQYRDYHLIENNCHQFIWQCFKPDDDNLTTFKALNFRLARLFDRKIYWDICDC